MESAENVRPGKVRKDRKAAKLLMMTLTYLFYISFILWLTVIIVSSFSRAQLRSSSFDIFANSYYDAVRAHSTMFRALACLTAFDVVQSHWSQNGCKKIIRE